MKGSLIENVKISSAITPTAGAAAQTAINGSTLDMLGYDGVLVVLRAGAITSTAVTSLKMQQDTASGMGTAADILGTSQTIADDADGKTFYVDLQPLERYVRVVVSRGTADAVISSAHYIQYKAGAKPVAAQGTDVSGETFIMTAEGTA